MDDSFQEIQDHITFLKNIKCPRTFLMSVFGIMHDYYTTYGLTRLHAWISGQPGKIKVKIQSFNIRHEKVKKHFK
jgi:hypothetical protein